MNYESSLITALLRSPKDSLKVKIEVNDFTDPFLANVFFVIRKLTAKGIAVDVMTVSEQLDNNPLAQIRDISKDACSVKNIKLYVDVIKAQTKLRKESELIHAASEALNAGAENVTADLITSLSGLNDTHVDHAYDMKDMLKKTIEDMDYRHELKLEKRMAGVPSGLSKLDMILGGFHNSDLVIIGARPAMGKTSCLLSCAYNAAKKGFKVGIISTEMSVTQLGTRLVSMVSNVPASTIRDSSYEDSDWARITPATSSLVGMNIFVYDKPVCSVSDISAQAMAWKIAHGIDIIFIDYLTRLKPEAGENRNIAIGNIATGLKTLARDMDIPVVCLAQLSREIEKRGKGDRLPHMGDLRDSGVIEQEADQVLMLYRDCVYNDEAAEDSAQINIAKNRHGATPLLNMRFKPQTMRWCDEVEFDGYEYN